MIDRPGRGLLRRASGGARTGGRPGGGDRGGQGGASGGFLQRATGGSGRRRGGRPRKSRSQTYIYGGGHGVMLLQTAAVCPNGAPRSSTTRRQRPLPGAAQRCIFIFVMAAAH